MTAKANTISSKRGADRPRPKHILAFLSFATPGAFAAETLPDWAPQPPPRIMEDRLRAEVLLLGAELDTKLRVDQSLDQPGTLIDAERDLGLERTEWLPMVELTLLPGERHLVRLSGLGVRRSAQATLTRQIDFDDQAYFAGERVDSEINLTMFGLAYGYRFLVRERAELTGTFGVQITEVEANAVVRSRVVRDADSAAAPLPFLGMEGRYDFTPRWSVEARLQYLSADIEQVDGEIFDARLAVTWRMNPYLVFGLGYRTFAAEVDSRDEDTPGLVDLDLSGALAFVRASL
ncbi:MAG: hypothetical protein RBS02_00245 [Steroidobacteraceae bacterium]|nr:hypothetical protein [Steroidobacteraceae bacterium]